MKIACLGGGPAGLYFAISMKLRQPDTQVTVFERNRANDTFGWGVVLSDDALGNLEANDPVSAATIRENFAYWDDIAVVHDGHRTVSGGHGFAGIGRMKLLTWPAAIAKKYESESGAREGITFLPRRFLRRSGCGDFFLDLQLLALELLDHRDVGRRPCLFVVQSGLEPCMLGLECGDMG